jgi:hypothetical protein
MTASAKENLGTCIVWGRDYTLTDIEQAEFDTTFDMMAEMDDANFFKLSRFELEMRLVEMRLVDRRAKDKS